jgi:hypothetical protein
MDYFHWLNMEDYKRKKGKDKRKETFKKYGKNTNRGLRHKLEQSQKKMKNNSTNECAPLLK